MVEMLIVGGAVFLLVAIAGMMLILRVQRQYLEGARVQQEAWERAQEARQRNQETRQEKEIAAFKQAITAQVEQIQEACAQQHEMTVTQIGIELELTRLPRVEDMPIHSGAAGPGSGLPASWRPAVLYRANLANRDISHRYLKYADLRGAQLGGANLSMADLAGASLVGADLSNANLAGANLSNADLREATLTGAILLVADLHRSNLRGANLQGIRSFTKEQLRSAIYDDTTQFDAGNDSTTPRLPALQPGERTKAAPVQIAAPRQEIVMFTAPETVESGNRAASHQPAMGEPEAPAGVTPTRPPETPIPDNEEPEPTIEMIAVTSPEEPGQDSEVESTGETAVVSPTGEEPEPTVEVPVVTPPTMLELAEETSPDLEQEIPKVVEETAPNKEEETSISATRAPEGEQEAGEIAEIRPAETPFSAPVLDTLPFIEQLLDAAPSSPQPASDSLLDPEVTDLLLDTPEDTHTEEFVKAIPTKGDSGR